MVTKQPDSIIYIASAKASFVLQDIDRLSQELEVNPFFFSGRKKWLVPVEMLQLFFFVLIRKRQPILISFGGYHSFMGTLAGKLKKAKSYIILNGTDSVAMPEFQYGHLRKGLLRWCCRKSYEWAVKIFPVSYSLIETQNNYAFQGKMLGLKATFPGLYIDYKVIPNGFDVDFWKAQNTAEAKSVITVATANRSVHKGVDLILQVAAKMKDYSFSIAGIATLDQCPENVKCLGYLSADDLRAEYVRNRYYFQLSIWEGFGCALCEAMLSGCIPLVSNVNMLPEIVADDRLVLHERSAEALELKMKELEAVEFQEGFFQDQIEARFSISDRISSLLKEIHVG